MQDAPLLLLLLLTFSSFLLTSTFAWEYANGGTWELLVRMGVSAMHMVLLPSGKLVVFDRTTAGPSNLTLPRCPLTGDCTVHSAELDPISRSFRPLTLRYDTFCSSGVLTASGILVQAGGFDKGDHAVRHFPPCTDDQCGWSEDPNGLAVRRWYATSQILEDGETVIVVGGRRQFNYEFVPRRPAAGGPLFNLPFLLETRHPVLENNLYPFVHLSPDGNLFIFANTKSILLDYRHHTVVRTFPEIPGNFSRNYPSSGSSVLLPLVPTNNSYVVADVLICGGAPPLSNLFANRSIFLRAADTCGRLRITDESPVWEMNVMPMARVMNDMVLLPTGDVLIVNGAGNGTAGWRTGRNPVLTPILYHTGATYSNVMNRFRILAPSSIPRLYHSSASLLPDGRVVVAGSNPNVHYQFADVTYPTELRVEAYHPPYMVEARPRIMWVSESQVEHGGRVRVRVGLTEGGMEGDVKVVVVAPGFSTHSSSMGQRMVVLRVEEVRRAWEGEWELEAVVPERAAVAPRGYYMMFVVHGGVPSEAQWLRIV